MHHPISLKLFPSLSLSLKATDAFDKESFKRKAPEGTDRRYQSLKGLGRDGELEFRWILLTSVFTLTFTQIGIIFLSAV